MAYDVFISYKHGALDGKGLTKDYQLAKDLHKTLLENGIKTFFSEKDLSTSGYIHEIYEALDEAKILVVVGTKLEHLESKWVSSEWETFLNAILTERKPDGEIYTYLDGLTGVNLPMALSGKQSYNVKQKNELIKRIKKNLEEKNTGKPFKTRIKVRPGPAPDLCVGEKLRFGKYPQGGKGETAPLVWRVLEIRNGRALLITDKLVDRRPYHDQSEEITWRDCSLRKWLNGEFFSQAFDSEQQAKIMLMTLQNPDNPAHGTAGGNVTSDKIFALSISDVDKYFSSNADRRAYPTAYAAKNGAYVDKTGGSWWWLRSPGKSGCAADVDYFGYFHVEGYDVSYNRVAVRPALWLNL